MLCLSVECDEGDKPFGRDVDDRLYVTPNEVDEPRTLFEELVESFFVEERRRRRAAVAEVGENVDVDSLEDESGFAAPYELERSFRIHVDAHFLLACALSKKYCKRTRESAQAKNEREWSKMKLVVIESPFAGNVEHNLAYVRAAMADCIRRGEAPYASHALFTQPGVLDDTKPEERTLGIEMGFMWGSKASCRVFYVDLGWSRGMKAALTKYRLEGLPYTFRVLGAPWSWHVGALGPDGESNVDVGRANQFAERDVWPGDEGYVEHQPNIDRGAMNPPAPSGGRR